MSGTGTVLMYPNLNQTSGPWNVVDPYGNPITISPSTTTQGLQEAINFAINNALPLRVYGQGITSTGLAPTLNCTTTIVISPKYQQTDIEFRNVNLNLIHPSDSNDGITFTGYLVGHFVFTGGEIGYSGTGTAVALRPNPTGSSQGIAVGVSYFMFSQIVAGNAAGSRALLEVDLTNGDVANTIIDGLEWNGDAGPHTDTSFGMLIHGQDHGHSFAGNIIRIAEIHKISQAGIMNGTSLTNQNLLNNNDWTIGSILPNGPLTTAFDTLGSNDSIRVGVSNSEGNAWRGLTFEPGSNGNVAHLRIADGVTTPFVNAGSNNQVFYNGKPFFQLPTSSPGVAGQLWNSGGTVKIA